MELGIIGLGKMGFNMAERLRLAGHKVVGFDFNKDATAKLTAAGSLDSATTNSQTRSGAAMQPVAFDRRKRTGLFAVATINQHAELHLFGTSFAEQRIHGGANGAAGIQNVVYQNDVLAGNRKTDLCLLHHGFGPQRR